MLWDSWSRAGSATCAWVIQPVNCYVPVLVSCFIFLGVSADTNIDGPQLAWRRQVICNVVYGQSGQEDSRGMSRSYCMPPLLIIIIILSTSIPTHQLSYHRFLTDSLRASRQPATRVSLPIVINFRWFTLDVGKMNRIHDLIGLCHLSHIIFIAAHIVFITLDNSNISAITGHH